MDFQKKEASEKSKKLERIDGIIQQINISWISPFSRDRLSGRYFYEILLSLLETLSNEIETDLDKKEKETEVEQRTLIADTLKLKPIISYQWDDGIRGRRQVVLQKFDNWEIIKPLIFKYDRLLRDYVSSHFKQVSYIEGLDDDDTDIED
jgi:hypothetical protein